MNTEKHPFKVDDIFYDTWGYEQTNVDFYQITRTTEKSIWMREIGREIVASTGFMQGKVMPIKGAFTGEEKRKTPLDYGSTNEDNGFFISSKHGWITKWKEGEEIHFTSYA